MKMGDQFKSMGVGLGKNTAASNKKRMRKKMCTTRAAHPFPANTYATPTVRESLSTPCPARIAHGLQAVSMGAFWWALLLACS